MTAIVPDVTVVVIVYNDAERLPRAVDSVLRQTLSNLEVVIADDCSTDSTPEVAARLAASDPRVRHVRLEQNSGGCSAPRNKGIEVSRAPYLMFLDSDDELPKHACKSMLLAIEESGVDFVTGEVERYFEATGKTGLWYPDLFTERQIVSGITEKPEMLFDHLSTNKIYRKAFIERHSLRFPEGIHYEDQLFSARAFVLAKSFEIVPWVVYRWRLADAAPAELSISSSRHKMQNVADRLKVATMVDDFVLSDDRSDTLKVDKDYKFLRHDFRLYLGDLPLRDMEWVEEFAELTTPYLATLTPEAFERLPRDERVCLHLLRTGRLAEAVDQARTLGRKDVAPRHAVIEGETTYWGSTPPDTEEGRRELDISELRPAEQPFLTALLRHEVESAEPEGSGLRLRIRTYDPGRVLASLSPSGRINLATTGAALRVPFALNPVAPGEYVGEVHLDLAKVPVSVNGFKSRRHPTITVVHDDQSNTRVLLAPLDMRPLTRPITYHRIGTHSLRVECEPRGIRRLEITWTRIGAFKEISRLGPVQRNIKRRIKRARKRLDSHENKATAYRMLTKLPVRKGLALFETVEGKGYLDNPRYIHEELVRQGRDIDVVWSYSGDTSSFPEGVKLVRRGSWQYVRMMARAQYWVDSHNLPSIYGKRPGNKYLQTWHGQTMKTIGFDVPSLRGGTQQARDKHQEMVNRWDVLISPSAEFERTFVPANNFKGNVIRAGYPRNDVLVRWSEPEQLERAAELRQRLEVPDDAKVLLYAPTFRDGARGSGSSLRIDLRELVDGLGPDWIVVVRAHYYDRFQVPTDLSHVLRDGSGIPDVNDLLLAADVLVTDYSSLMFDYANIGRPILLFVDDYETYKHGDRGTYYDLEDIAPGPMLRETSELVEALEDLDGVRAEYGERYLRFQEMFCSYETGHASKAVVDAFFGEDDK